MCALAISQDEIQWDESGMHLIAIDCIVLHKIASLFLCTVGGWEKAISSVDKIEARTDS